MLTLKQYFLVRVAWHHTGSWFNETDFYEIDDRCNVPDFTVLDNYEKENKLKPEHLLQKARVSWVEFEGTRRRHKKIDREAYAILKGDWAYTLEEKKKNQRELFLYRRRIQQSAKRNC